MRPADLLKRFHAFEPTMSTRELAPLRSEAELELPLN